MDFLKIPVDIRNGIYQFLCFKDFATITKTCKFLLKDRKICFAPKFRPLKTINVEILFNSDFRWKDVKIKNNDLKLIQNLNYESVKTVEKFSLINPFYLNCIDLNIFSNIKHLELIDIAGENLFYKIIEFEHLESLTLTVLSNNFNGQILTFADEIVPQKLKLVNSLKLQNRKLEYLELGIIDLIDFFILLKEKPGNIYFPQLTCLVTHPDLVGKLSIGIFARFDTLIENFIFPNLTCFLFALGNINVNCELAFRDNHSLGYICHLILQNFYLKNKDKEVAMKQFQSFHNGIKSSELWIKNNSRFSKIEQIPRYKRLFKLTSCLTLTEQFDQQFFDKNYLLKMKEVKLNDWEMGNASKFLQNFSTGTNFHILSGNLNYYSSVI